MRRFAWSLLLFWVFLSPAAGADALGDRIGAARGVAQRFMGELKEELVKALQAEGAVAAIGVCGARAPAIAVGLSLESGWEVGRTSLRVRNPGNAPDHWEGQVLAEFEARRERGEEVAGMERAEVVMVDGVQKFRYMKAIPTAGLCLTCHGSALSPEVVSTLRELYPEDQATGFGIGEIRGAFTITQPLD